MAHVVRKDTHFFIYLFLVSLVYLQYFMFPRIQDMANSIATNGPIGQLRPFHLQILLLLPTQLRSLAVVPALKLNAPTAPILLRPLQ
jgi:hypothetical protein